MAFKDVPWNCSEVLLNLLGSWSNNCSNFTAVRHFEGFGDTKDEHLNPILNDTRGAS